MISTICLSLLFSIRCYGGGEKCCGDLGDDDEAGDAVANGHNGDGGNDDDAGGGPGGPRPRGASIAGAAVKIRSPTTTTLDAKLVHPLARRLCCACCSQRKVKPEQAFR